MKIMAKHRTSSTARAADPFDEAGTEGWDWTLYSDGHVSAEYYTCWGGCMTGERYVSPIGEIDFADAIDAAAALDVYVTQLLVNLRILVVPWHIEHRLPRWKKTRNGYKVQ